MHSFYFAPNHSNTRLKIPLEKCRHHKLGAGSSQVRLGERRRTAHHKVDFGPAHLVVVLGNFVLGQRLQSRRPDDDLSRVELVEWSS